MNESSELNATLARCFDGDDAAWERLVDALWPVVAGSVWKSIGSSMDANAVDDVCQDVFVKLCADDCRMLRRFDPARGALERYAAVVARSTALDAVRGRGRGSRTVSLDVVAEKASSSEDALPMLEDWELAAALGTLTDRERQVMDMLYRREMSTAETAKELGMAESTVRIHKMSGLAKLRKYFGVNALT